ncbi:MAG TPA: YeeE/YedE thiosulfate transporter family protein [Pseudobdellovibrionaceae bacterium]|nr:YeeE/YedE thiosulfate transporter family protein [Pseudobdellovibrionaceae bacterium]
MKKPENSHHKKSEVSSYINPYIGGILLGVVLFLSYFLTGGGLGASGAIGRVQTGILDFIVPHHVDTNPYFAAIAGGDKNPWLDGSVFMLLGTFLGGAVSGILSKRVKFEIRKGDQITSRTRLLFALIGGLMMGWGARLARGCTSGQALSGGAVLSAGSWAFMFSVFGGGYLLAYFVRRLWLPANPQARG